MLTKLNVTIVSQYIHTSNHNVVHLILIQCYMSIMSQLKNNNNNSKVGRSGEKQEEKPEAMNFKKP